MQCCIDQASGEDYWSLSRATSQLPGTLVCLRAKVWLSDMAEFLAVSPSDETEQGSLGIQCTQAKAGGAVVMLEAAPATRSSRLQTDRREVWSPLRTDLARSYLGKKN